MNIFCNERGCTNLRRIGEFKSPPTKCELHDRAYFRALNDAWKCGDVFEGCTHTGSGRRPWCSQNGRGHRAAVERYGLENALSAWNGGPGKWLTLTLRPRAPLTGRALDMREAYRLLPRLDGLQCVYCGAPAESRDHVIPWALGGLAVEGNIVPACKSCNSSKGPRTPDQWAIQNGIWLPS